MSVALFAFLAMTIFLFTPIFTSANVVINEICPTGCASSDHQWVEIFNPDASAIDLTGWKFWENSTRHGLTISSSSLKQSFSLEPSEYAVITQNDEMFCADHPGFSSAIFDSVWGTLKNDGEEIGLKDNGDNFVEQFTYKAVTNFSLQRKDATISPTDSTNWCEHESGNTVGAVNVCLVAVETPTTTDQTPNSDNQTPTTTPTTTAFAVTPPLKINEFLPNPSTGEEWIEIYNPSASTVDLTGWKIFDSIGEIATPTGTIGAGGFFVVELSASKLNNDGDTITLKDASNTVIDTTSYTTVHKGNSIARSVDGAGSFQETTTFTRGTANVITAPIVNTPSGGGGGGSSNNYVAPPVVTTPDIVINELVSDPTDGAVEFVELYNKSNASVNLAGWWIEEGSGSRNVLSGSIAPLGFFVLEKPNGNLNNAGDIVRLMLADGKEVDKVTYGNWNDGSASNNAVIASDPFSLARKTDGYDTNNDHSNFVITSQITKGWPNVIVLPGAVSNTVSTTISTTSSTTIQTASEKEENTLPMISILLPEEIVVGEVVEFDASETIDLEEDELSFAWDFGDGSHAYGETVLHEYKEDGTFTISLVVKDGAGQSKETAKVKITNSKLQISNDGEALVAAKITVKATASAAKGSYLGLVGLDKISETSTGDKVKVRGTVAVLPNVFGSQYFYISTSTYGAQIYMNSKKFPELQVGDVVEVSGEISEPYGEKRVKVKNTTDIKVIGHTDSVLPAELTTTDLSESVGALVKLKGEITEMKSAYLYIDDGEGEVKVVFKRGANIGKGDWRIGDLVEVVGVVGQSSSGVQFMPRSQMDIVKTGHVEKDPLASSGQAKNETTETYLTATAGGLTSILISLAAKARGKVAFGLLKRVGGLALLVVKRKTKV